MRLIKCFGRIKSLLSILVMVLNDKSLVFRYFHNNLEITTILDDYYINFYYPLISHFFNKYNAYWISKLVIKNCQLIYFNEVVIYQSNIFAPDSFLPLLLDYLLIYRKIRVNHIHVFYVGTNNSINYMVACVCCKIFCLNFGLRNIINNKLRDNILINYLYFMRGL